VHLSALSALEFTQCTQCTCLFGPRYAQYSAQCVSNVLLTQQILCTRMQSALSLSEKSVSLIFTVPNPRVLLLLASSP
jgi:hypothetical protein